MKKKNFEHKIRAVLPRSIAEELELEPGDVLLAVNDLRSRMFLIIIIIRTRNI